VNILKLSFSSILTLFCGFRQSILILFCKFR